MANWTIGYAILALTLFFIAWELDRRFARLNARISKLEEKIAAHFGEEDDDEELSQFVREFEDEEGPLPR